MGGCGKKKSESFQRSDINRFLYSWKSSQKPISSSSHLADITPPSSARLQASGRVKQHAPANQQKGGFSFQCPSFEFLQSRSGGKEKRGLKWVRFGG